MALFPHVPGHGSLHFMFMQAKLYEHSLLLTHSGRHFGGAPIYSGKHEHDGDVPCTWHCEYGPHGDGTHGFRIGSSSISALIIILIILNVFIIFYNNT